jgi:hypothetical protein
MRFFAIRGSKKALALYGFQGSGGEQNSESLAIKTFE